MQPEVEVGQPVQLCSVVWCSGVFEQLPGSSGVFFLIQDSEVA